MYFYKILLHNYSLTLLVLIPLKSFLKVVTMKNFLLFKQNGMSPDQAALTSWYISSACCFFIGFVKFIVSFFVHKIKNLLPTVALLGGLAGVAIGLIAFMPLISMLEYPIVSFAVLSVIVMVYFAGFRLPANLPAILVA